jgi:hypothetical protein
MGEHLVDSAETIASSLAFMARLGSGWRGARSIFVADDEASARSVAHGGD